MYSLIGVYHSWISTSRTPYPKEWHLTNLNSNAMLRNRIPHKVKIEDSVHQCEVEFLADSDVRSETSASLSQIQILGPVKVCEFVSFFRKVIRFLITLTINGYMPQSLNMKSVTVSSASPFLFAYYGLFYLQGLICS